jgi:hypothetical protein
MRVSPENYSDPRSLTAEFAVLATAEAVRLQRLSDFFGDALPIVIDNQEVNERLTTAGRLDLTIADQAALIGITHPDDVLYRGCNFGPNFAFYTGFRDTGREEWGKKVVEPVPATAAEILALRNLPKFQSVHEVSEIIDTGWFPALGDNANHSSTTAFIRMLILFPDFTVSLVRHISDPENGRRDWKYQNELYVAYQLMSRLVDTSDMYVISEGEVNQSYLLS